MGDPRSSRAIPGLGKCPPAISPEIAQGNSNVRAFIGSKQAGTGPNPGPPAADRAPRTRPSASRTMPVMAESNANCPGRSTPSGRTLPGSCSTSSAQCGSTSLRRSFPTLPVSRLRIGKVVKSSKYWFGGGAGRAASRQANAERQCSYRASREWQTFLPWFRSDPQQAPHRCRQADRWPPWSLPSSPHLDRHRIRPR